MHRWPLTTRLLIGAVLLLVPALVATGLGAKQLMRHSLRRAVDGQLSVRLDRVAKYVAEVERTLPESELEDELQEYADLSAGDVLLEIRDDSGKMLCGPLLSGWNVDARLQALAADPSARPRFADAWFQGHPFRVAGAFVQNGPYRFHILAAASMAAPLDAVEDFEWTIAAVLPAVLVLALAGTYWIGRRALAPVDRMTRAAQAITVRDLHRRLDAPVANDEIGRLASTLNTMLARLEVAVNEMARFTAEAAHELRTPVTLVRTGAEVALARDRSPDEYRAALGGILAQAERMSGLVNDLLLLARSDASASGDEAAELTDVVPLLRELVNERQVESTRRGLSLTSRLPSAATVSGGPASLRRIFATVLDNALKYTPSGVIDVSATIAGPRVVIDVTDTGIGLEAGEDARAFDRFFRGPRARQAAPDGAGLGLSIARTDVERAGGTIVIAPGPDGRGARVRVELPVVAWDAATSGA